MRDENLSFVLQLRRVDGISNKEVGSGRNVFIIRKLVSTASFPSKSIKKTGSKLCCSYFLFVSKHIAHRDLTYLKISAVLNFVGISLSGVGRPYLTSRGTCLTNEGDNVTLVWWRSC